MRNLKYKFKEDSLGQNFCSEQVEKIRKLLDANVSFTTIAMTSVGVSYILRYITMIYPAHFVFLDMYSLPNLTKNDFFTALLKELGGEPKRNNPDIVGECKKMLEQLVLKKEKVVIIFNRFDQLENEFDRNFFADLRSLRNVDPHKTVMIFTSIKPLYEIAQDAITGANLNLVHKYVFLKPFCERDMKILIAAKILTKPASKGALKKIIRLSGGHSQLYQILAKTEQENPLKDHFAKLQLKELYESLSYRQRKQLRKITSGKDLSKVDEYLINIGMVKTQRGKFELFTPLLADYVKSNAPFKLPVKEAKLFRVLKMHTGVLVPKEALFNMVWDDPSETTDWALDSLIYRLRKNPLFKSSGFEIENQKKLGYILVKD